VHTLFDPDPDPDPDPDLLGLRYGCRIESVSLNTVHLELLPFA
jgi:hypothetical protein